MGCLKLEEYHDQKPLKVVYSKAKNQSLGRGDNEVGLIVAGLNHVMHGMFNPPGDGKETLDIDKLMEHYPGDESNQISSTEAYTQTGGKVEAFYNDYVDKNGAVPNACALRMSIAMNEAGYDISKSANTLKGANGKNYYLSSTRLRDYIKNNYNVISKTTTNSTLSSFNGMKGVYFMLPSDTSQNGFGAYGHITMWNGNACLGGHCYNNSPWFKSATLIK